jgi:hypothetical protein
MERPGNLVFYGVLFTLGLQWLFHPAAWLVIVAGLALGWFINEGQRKQDAEGS